MDNNYNDEPVFYCLNCLSLAVLTINLNGKEQDFCNHCGSVSIGETDIKTWEDKYKEKYKTTFLKQKKYGKK